MNDEIKEDVNETINVAKNLLIEMDEYIKFIEKSGNQIIDYTSAMDDKSNEQLIHISESIVKRHANKPIIMSSITDFNDTLKEIPMYLAHDCPQMVYMICTGNKIFLEKYIKNIAKNTKKYFDDLYEHMEVVSNLTGENKYSKDDLNKKILNIEPDFGYHFETTNLVYEFIISMKYLPFDDDIINAPHFETVFSMIESELENIRDCIFTSTKYGINSSGKSLLGFMYDNKMAADDILEALMKKYN